MTIILWAAGKGLDLPLVERSMQNMVKARLRKAVQSAVKRARSAAVQRMDDLSDIARKQFKAALNGRVKGAQTKSPSQKALPSNVAHAVGHTFVQNLQRVREGVRRL